jgi:hypothetical protein
MSRRTVVSMPSSTDALLNELGVPQPPRSKRSVWIGIGVGFAVIVLTALLVLAIVSIISTRQLADSNYAVAHSNRVEIAQLKAATSTVNKILGEAGTVSKALENNQLAICTALHITTCH